jgi:hypothetical protein
MKPLSQRELRKEENWACYVRASKKVKETKRFKKFIRESNLCVESNKPLYGLKYH